MDIVARHLIIQADANAEIGIGHLMRCLALGQAWKDAGGKVIFVTSCQNEGLLQRLRVEDFEIHSANDWKHTNYPDAWIALDGYHFNESYQQQVKESGHKLLVIDDMAHLKHYYADIMLNQNLQAEQLQYSCEPYTTLLLGTQYTLLRREFFEWKDWERKIPDIAHRVLVTLGGSDYENYTLKVIQALQNIEITDLEVIIIIGASNPHFTTLEIAIKQSHIPTHLIFDTQNMSELMAWADIAISGSGTTIWELSFLGTPILALILADNQHYIAEQIELQGAGQNLGNAENLSNKTLTKAINSLLRDSKLRARMSCKARNIIDGEGAKRVINSIQRNTNEN